MIRHNPLFDLVNVTVRAKQIKQDEERAKKYVTFAITSIVYSVLMVLFAVGAGFFIGLLATDAAMLAIFIIAGFVLCLVGVLISFLGSLLRVIAQLTINRKVIGWIALAIFIAATAASIALVLAIPGL